MVLGLAGRTVIVTGAARGQGAAEAEILVAEGVRVIGADILGAEGKDLAERLNALGPGRWSTGTMLGMRAIAPLMPSDGSAAIVNIGSIAGLTAHFAIAYTATKRARAAAEGCQPGRGAKFMELTMLTVPGCPNAAALEERLAAVLADYPGAVVRRRQVADEQEAAETGMAGSPTLLINGTDPFAAPGQAPGLSCRLYRDAAGRLAGAPSAEDLRRALEQADADG